MHRYVITGLLVPCLMLGASITAASSQEMKNPRISPAHTDWQAVGAELEALNPSNAHLQSGSGETRQLVSLAEQELNAATSSEFRNIAESPIPVLLPFDSAAFLRNRAVLGPESQKTAAKGISIRLQLDTIFPCRAQRLRCRCCRSGKRTGSDKYWLFGSDLRPYFRSRFSLRSSRADRTD